MCEKPKPKPVIAIIGDMKNAVLDRCRDRIEAARKKPKEKEDEEEEYDITSTMKRNRGL
jgi:hypothetical protein